MPSLLPEPRRQARRDDAPLSFQASTRTDGTDMEYLSETDLISSQAADVDLLHKHSPSLGLFFTALYLTHIGAGCCLDDRRRLHSDELSWEESVDYQISRSYCTTCAENVYTHGRGNLREAEKRIAKQNLQLLPFASHAPSPRRS